MDNKKNNKIDFVEFPVQNVKDLLKTKSFYTNIFKWNYQDWGNYYSDTTESGVGTGLNADSSHNSNAPLSVIYVGNISETKDKIINSGGKITKDIFTFPGGRRFHFVDPAGNELAVWSDK